MRDPEKPRTHYTLVQLLPNMLTTAAICAGLSAIRFAVQGNYVLAVQLILIASLLDGLDGRLARLLRSDSKLGAELDSLADFLNFGVATPLVIYFWALQNTHSGAWISVLVFAICCVVRLARFNVSSKSDGDDGPGAYFSGVPSPAGALLVLLPMYVSFGFDHAPKLPAIAISAYMVLIGLAMIGQFPTWSFKTTRISRENVKYFLVAFAFIAAAALTYTWFTLVALCVAYIAMVLWGLLRRSPAKIDKDG